MLSINKLFNYFSKKDIVLSIKVAVSRKYLVIFSSLENNNLNFGDRLNEYILNKISKKKVVFSHNIINFLNKKVYSFIGSILDYSRIRNLTVLGSGYINSNRTNSIIPKRVEFIRGHLSLSKYNKLTKKDIKVPFGDPSILVKKLYNPNLPKIYDYGIIPHYIDKNNPFLSELIREISSKSLKYILIDVFDKTENIIDNIKKSKKILSSSLHGLIISDLYCVPNRWVKFSENIYGGNFKFDDYYSSLSKDPLFPVVISENFNFSNFENLLECNFFNLKKMLVDVENSLPKDLFNY